jgi:hypothetical protein
VRKNPDLATDLGSVDIGQTEIKNNRRDSTGTNLRDCFLSGYDVGYGVPVVTQSVDERIGNRTIVFYQQYRHGTRVPRNI